MNDREDLWRNTNPRFSPDGREIVFATRPTGPYGELEVVNLDSSKIRAVTDSNALALSPAWSPDGRFIYFASSRGGTMNIWKISAQGGDPVQITSGQGDDAQLDVSSDGKRIVFSTWRINTNIAQLDLATKTAQPNPKLLTTDPARNQNAPAYSPDGKYIAYFSNLKGAENESIWISNADGSNPIQLVRDGQIDVFPLWTPDSQRVIYRAEPEAGSETNNDYRSVAVSGGVPETILRKGTGDYFDVGSDGRLLFWNAEGGLDTLDLHTGKRQFFSKLPISLKWVPLRFSPDERSVAYIVPEGREGDPNGGLWVNDLKNPPRQVFRGWVLWYARGPRDTLYLLSGEPNLKAILWKVGWDGRGLERIVENIPINYSYWEDPAQNPQDFFDVSPDGKHAAFESQSVLSATIGMITNVR
jgi:Tol biopolymer transport system component